jgi:hypothetical protein
VRELAVGSWVCRRFGFGSREACGGGCDSGVVQCRETSRHLIVWMISSNDMESLDVECCAVKLLDAVH